jgi:hypothetical protein
MKRIVRLTESDLSRIVKKVIKEQTELKPNKEINPNKERIIPVKFSIYKKNAKLTVKLSDRDSFQHFDKCVAGLTSGNCFEYPSNLTDGEYTVNNFTGDIFFIHQSKKYRCKLSKPCQPL